MHKHAIDKCLALHAQRCADRRNGYTTVGTVAASEEDEEEEDQNLGKNGKEGNEGGGGSEGRGGSGAVGGVGSVVAALEKEMEAVTLDVGFVVRSCLNVDTDHNGLIDHLLK